MDRLGSILVGILAIGAVASFGVLVAANWRRGVVNDPQNWMCSAPKPIVLAAESEDGDIILVDAENNTLVLKFNTYAARAISKTYEPGDVVVAASSGDAQ